MTTTKIAPTTESPSKETSMTPLIIEPQYSDPDMIAQIRPLAGGPIRQIAADGTRWTLATATLYAADHDQQEADPVIIPAWIAPSTGGTFRFDQPDAIVSDAAAALALSLDEAEEVERLARAYDFLTTLLTGEEIAGVEGFTALPEVWSLHAPDGARYRHLADVLGLMGDLDHLGPLHQAFLQAATKCDHTQEQLACLYNAMSEAEAIGLSTNQTKIVKVAA